MSYEIISPPLAQGKIEFHVVTLYACRAMPTRDYPWHMHPVWTRTRLLCSLSFHAAVPTAARLVTRSYTSKHMHCVMHIDVLASRIRKGRQQWRVHWHGHPPAEGLLGGWEYNLEGISHLT